MSATGADLPRAIYSSEQVRGFDRYAIDRLGIDGFELMRRAADAALACLRARWPAARRLEIHCGAGNNAGDGYLLAALARQAGLEPAVIAAVDPARLGGDARRAADLARDAGVPLRLASGDAGSEAGRAVGAGIGERDAPELRVDALLGTGLSRAVDGPIAAAVDRINRRDCPVLALDIPTGLDSDSGAVRGRAVRADATISFVGLKAGLFLGQGPAHCGRIVFSGLGLPDPVFADAAPVLRRIDPAGPGRILEPRSRLSHKYMNGNVLVVGGAPGMSGAARLAAEAALRAGAGLVRAAVAPDSVAAVMAGRPEIMCRGVREAGELDAWLDEADVVVLGPGLGRAAWGKALADRLLGLERPLVVDADALGWLAADPVRRASRVLTPHPGEAARLLGCTSAEVQADRLGAVTGLAARYGGIVVLKGACTLIAASRSAPDETGAVGPTADGAGACPAVCDFGNPGMATAGMGDVLAGVIGALVAQFGLSAGVVEAGVLVHALAGDDAARDGERGLIASDLFAHLRRHVNPAR